ncbi:hypothetical protein ACQP2U_43930 (plasmid) [Nocardia sp. CA-084685]|uniref:hypothetical protein n=1 Tax=Nocardia sp. CA-084685 TaxID=3239970 RepID=UPI003D989221
MVGSHSERADELAEQANKALQELLEATQARADGEQIDALTAAVNRGGPSRADVLWMRLQALQNQAQIHATLALKDTVFARGL